MIILFFFDISIHNGPRPRMVMWGGFLPTAMSQIGAQFIARCSWQVCKTSKQGTARIIDNGVWGIAIGVATRTQ